MAYDEKLEVPRCGVGLFSTGPDDPFINACQFHDRCYLENSWAENNLGRHMVDLTFLNQMLLIAAGDLVLQARAYFYYEVARAFGNKYWEGSKS